MNHVSPLSSVVASGTTPADRPAAAKKTSGASFAQVHAAAVRTAAKDDGAKTEGAATAKSAPKGEKSAKVDGHHYAEIVAGPRNGMFINTSDNSRSGEAFVMVKREGRQFHIYGSGEDRAVYEVSRKESAPASAPKTGSSTADSGRATT